MINYPKKKSIAKKGVNYVRQIFEDNNFIFHELHQENEIGIDAIVEIITNEKPMGELIALQIKSGNSYFNEKSNCCIIPIKKHYEYWKNFSLPLFGIVYIPSKRKAYWADIKNALQDLEENIKSIKYVISSLNEFSESDFLKIFVPYITKQIPILTFEECIRLFNSKKDEEEYVGTLILFKKFGDKKETWDLFIDYFKKSNLNQISPKLIYYLSYVPGHQDLFWNNETLTNDSLAYAKSLIGHFGEKEVIKLLNFIDENFIDRGSIGECVEAIISIIPNYKQILSSISEDINNEGDIRKCAKSLLIYMN